MDLAALTADIDELLGAFVEIGGQELSQMKELWRLRSFTFIHEAKPSHVNAGFFMQALYSGALDLLGRTSQWSRKVGGLYVLYILYETQLSVPPYKIYLSADDLDNIYSLVKEAKSKDSLTALRVVNRMMVRDSFLYGSVTISGKKMRETYHELSSRAAEHVKKARERILASSSAKEHFEGSLIKDLGLDGLALLNEEYAMAKQRVFKGASSTQGDLDNLGSILGEELSNEVKSWMEKRKRFFGKEDQESLLPGEVGGKRNALKKPFDATGSSDKEGEESTDFTEPRCQDRGSAINLNILVDSDDFTFETELENALDED